jgi:hypothetical protein
MLESGAGLIQGSIRSTLITEGVHPRVMDPGSASGTPGVGGMLKMTDGRWACTADHAHMHVSSGLTQADMSQFQVQVGSIGQFGTKGFKPATTV